MTIVNTSHLRFSSKDKYSRSSRSFPLRRVAEISRSGLSRFVDELAIKRVSGEDMAGN
jgi:hypothetical protein